MSRRDFFPAIDRWAPWTVLAALATLGIAFSSLAYEVHTAELRIGPQSSASVAKRMLGSSRSALSEHFQLMTDIYFHAGGTGRHDERHWPDTWARTLGREIVPREHIHVSGAQLAEMMAPLWMAIRTDPHNIENYLIAVFWLRSELDTPSFDLAREVLRQGQLSNPRSFRIRMERGLLFLREGRLEQAAAALDAALELWPHPEDPDDPQAKQDKAAILTYRALLHETSNEIPEAVIHWQRVLDLFPGRESINARLADLKEGRPTAQASEVWLRMIRRDDREMEKGLCDHHHHHEPDSHN